MSKVILFRIIHARNQITKLFIVPWNACYYEELEPVEIQNTKTSTAFLKIGKYLEKENWRQFDLTSKFIFFRIESMFCEPILKNTIQCSQYLSSSFSIYLHHLVFIFIIQYFPSLFIISILSIYVHSLLNK